MEIQTKLSQSEAANADLHKKLKDLDATFSALQNSYNAQRNDVVIQIARTEGSIVTLKELLNAEGKKEGVESKE
jgi:hypothetical protein